MRSLGRRFVLGALAFVSACESKAPPPPPVVDERTAVTTRARDVLDALASKNMERLASFVHPTAGVRFSPYPYVGPNDRSISRAGVAKLWTDSAKYAWGFADGSGDPLVMTFPAYYGRFIYNHDFAHAPKTAYFTTPIRPSNALSNLSAMYPAARWIEYHFPGFDPKYDGMDWSSLWLVFQRAGDAWFLVGVVHGSWTI